MNRRLGKKPARHDPRSLRLSRYVRPSLPPPPPSVDWSLGATYGMLANDVVGDCAIAGPDHLMQTWTTLRGAEIEITDAQALADYQAISGYDPGRADAQGNNPTDAGCVLLDVLKRWRNDGLAGGRKILAFASVAPSASERVQTGASLFGGLLIGLNLPQSAMDQIDAGQGWSVVDGSPSLGGHAVCIVAYDPDGLTCVTWGQRQRMTWEFFQTFCDECWACLSQDFSSGDGGHSPCGFDLDALMGDLNAL